jgi:predicted Zn finger-like uncharacterized protein
MTVTCPVCGTRYRVDEQNLGGLAGRPVRCANCGHTWHQEPPASEARAGEAAPSIESPRREPAIESSAPRPPLVPSLEVPPRPQPAPPLTSQRSRHGWAVFGWAAAVLLVLLVVLAVLTGIVARRQLVAMWPPAERFYASIGLPVEPSGTGLVIGKITPMRTADGLVIDGEIANLGSTPRDVPRLRVALQDAAEKEVQFEVVAPPKARLQPGEIVHFATPFAHPVDAATGVVVTFTAP